MKHSNCSSKRAVVIYPLFLLSAACYQERRPEPEDVPAQGVIAAKSSAEEDRWIDSTVMAGHEVDGVAVLAAVRTARHQEYERMVFEFRGEQLPNYRVRYIDEPVTRCESGETLSLDGDSWLEVRFEPSAIYDDKGKPTLPSRSLAPSMANLRQLELICDFESTLTWVAWLAGRDRFRILELKGPPRLVVDIR